MRSPEAVAAMLCPVCKVGLHMSDRQGVEIDYCPQCRGVWLDRGELDKIIERAGAEMAPPPPAPQAAPQPWGSSGPGLADVARDMLRGGSTQHYGERGYDPRYGHKKRKKSFLEQMFD